MAPSLSLCLLLCNSFLASIAFSSAAPGFKGFGGAAVVDDKLREGPEADSNLIGRAQGLSPAVSQEEPTFNVALNFVFTDGKYNGSTLAVYGRIVVASDTREWSIIGGTGQFRLARGYVLGKKLTPPAPGDFLVELDIYVL